MNSSCTDSAFEPNRYHAAYTLTQLSPSSALTDLRVAGGSGSGMEVAAQSDEANGGCTVSSNCRLWRWRGHMTLGQALRSREVDGGLRSGPVLGAGCGQGPTTAVAQGSEVMLVGLVSSERGQEWWPPRA